MSLWFILIALGGAHPPYFSLLAQRKVGKRNGTPRLGRCCAPTALRASAQDRRCGTRDLRSLRQSSRSSVLTLQCSATPKGAASAAAQTPLGRRRAAQQQAEASEGCLRAASPSSRAPTAARGAGHPARQRGASPGCPFFWLLFFGQAKKSNGNVRRTVLAEMHDTTSSPNTHQTS